MEIDGKFNKIGNLFTDRQIKKAPAYQWQELALLIINEFKIPDNKKSSVFKVCKQKPRQFVLNCFNDTKELCTSGEKWKYFFKIINGS